MSKTRIMVTTGLLISLNIVLTRLLSFQTPIMRVGFGFIPVAITSILFGPVTGGIAAAVADVAGMMVFPQGIYFPGFTFSAFVSGVIYGAFLYKKPNSLMQASLSVLAVMLVADLGFNTLWLSVITGKAASALIIPRFIKGAIMFPVQVFLISITWKCLLRSRSLKYLKT